MTSQWFKESIHAGAVAILASVFAGPVFAAGDPDHVEIEFPAETAAMLDATVALFEAVEATAPPPASTPVLGNPLAIPASFETDIQMSNVFPLNRGPVQHLTGYRINWYPVDRLLGAVDFMGTYDGNRNLVCGYVTWDLTDPKTPTLDHVVATYVDLAVLTDATPAEAQMALLDANCAYGEIDPNFTVFQPES